MSERDTFLRWLNKVENLNFKREWCGPEDNPLIEAAWKFQRRRYTGTIRDTKKKLDAADQRIAELEQQLGKARELLADAIKALPVNHKTHENARALLNKLDKEQKDE
jgi:hypothetical protein